MLVIGKNPVLELLETNPKEFNKIILLKTIKPEAKSVKIKELAEENGIQVLMLRTKEFLNFFNRKNKDEGITQGVIGFIKDFQYSDLRDIVEGASEIKYPMLLLLDEITDPHNLGAIIRSAVCLGCDGIVIPRHNSAEINHTVLKTSSGAASKIKIAKETNLVNTIVYLKKHGYFIMGADAKADKFTFEKDFKKPIALILGSEGKGIRDLLKKNCDELVRIPMTPGFDSLNVSVSAGVILYEAFRQKQVG